MDPLLAEERAVRSRERSARAGPAERGSVVLRGSRAEGAGRRRRRFGASGDAGRASTARSHGEETLAAPRTKVQLRPAHRYADQLAVRRHQHRCRPPRRARSSEMPVSSDHDGFERPHVHPTLASWRSPVKYLTSSARLGWRYAWQAQDPRSLVGLGDRAARVAGRGARRDRRRRTPPERPPRASEDVIGPAVGIRWTTRSRPSSGSSPVVCSRPTATDPPHRCSGSPFTHLRGRCGSRGSGRPGPRGRRSCPRPVPAPAVSPTSATARCRSVQRRLAAPPLLAREQVEGDDRTVAGDVDGLRPDARELTLDRPALATRRRQRGRSTATGPASTAAGRSRSRRGPSATANTTSSWS